MGNLNTTTGDDVMQLEIDKEIKDAVAAFTEAEARFEKFKRIASNLNATDGQCRDMLMYLNESKSIAYLLAHLIKRKIEES